MTIDQWKKLDVIILGAGLGGLTAAIAFRRGGHIVRIYERYHFAGEVGASLSCASTGGKILKELDVPLLDTKPIILKKLIRHDWGNGEIEGVYDLGDYEEMFGSPYYNLHRIDIHTTLLETATKQEGKGTPCQLIVDHRATTVDYENGHIVFENGVETDADLIVAADGIRSATREQIGNVSDFTLSTSCCYRCLFKTEDVLKLGLHDFSKNEAIEYWGGVGKNKIVMSPCSNGDIVSCYCFYPSEYNDLRDNGWDNDATQEDLVNTFKDLDPEVLELFKMSFDIKQWRLYIHKPYDIWQNGKVVMLGDSIHPMMPDQSLGAVQAFEDAFTLGWIFNQNSGYSFEVEQGLKLYEQVRKPRATRIQAASLRARENINERIGFSSQTSDLKSDKLTINEVCSYDIKKDIEEKARLLNLI